MGENRYNIVFSGDTVTGIGDIGKFIRELSVLLKGTSVSVETLFSERQVVIEKAASLTLAEERCRAFEKTGIICHIVSLDEDMPPPLPIGNPEPQFGPASKPVEMDIPPPIPQTGNSVPKPVPSVYDMIPRPGKPEPRFGTVSKPAEKEIPPPLPARVPKKQDELTRYSWEPAKPAALDHTLKAVSGWPKLIAPFLVQNIGWFISGFLFLTGCVFLVTYTQGFSRSLIISLILSAYTLLLIGGAYRLLLQRPELRAAGSVLLTIGMLMIPLSIAASVRLTDTAWPESVSSAVGIVIVVMTFGVFYWAAQLASGIMNRTLQGSHTRLFMALTSVQIAAPVVGRVSEWYIPALLHLSLLVLLGIGLVRFIREWLKSLFSEQRNLAYYAAGTLIYAATVSFIHLTWRYRHPLPPGYTGPFLMILAGFLFYADSGFKEQTHRYAFLSRFTFAVYALSILALFLGFPSFEARVITLTLGAGVYATVFRQYLTLPPLYLLMICICGLYHQFILQYLSQEIWFLAGLPGLVCLFAAHRHVIKHKAGKLLIISFRSLLILTVGLAGKSLFISEPGPISVATAAMLTALLYIALRYTSSELSVLSSDLPQGPEPYDLRNSSWFYLVPISGAVTLGYCPLFGHWAWAEQFSLSLMLLAIVLTQAGLSLYRKISGAIAVRTLVLLNSAVFSVFIADFLYLFSASAKLLQSTGLHLTLLLSAGIFLWQSLALRIRFLFYAALISGSAAGVFIKYSYFPYPSTGMTEIIAALLIWLILWRAERTEALKQKIGIPESHFSLLTSHFSLLSLHSSLSRIEVIRLPLKQFIVILWVIALSRFLFYLPNYSLTPVWALNSSLMVMTAMLFVVYFRILGIWPMPMLLGLTALLIPIFHQYKLGFSELSFTAALYALVFWTAIQKTANIPLTYRTACLLNLAGGHNGGRHQVETRTYQTASLIIFSALSVAIWQWLNRPAPTILATLFTAILFLSLTNRYYRRSGQAYIMLTLLTMAALVIHVRILSVRNVHLLLSDSRTGLLFALISLCMGAAAWILGRNAEDKRSHFYEPLLRIAILLSLIAAGQQLPLMSARMLVATPVVALGLASLSLLFSNHKTGSRILCLIGVFSVNLTLLWANAFLFHKGESLIFWPSHKHGDVQIFPALLALGFSSLSYAINGHPRSSLYVRPLWYVAAADYCWPLVCIAVLFTADIFTQSSDLKSTALFFISAVAVFPLSAPLPRGELWRGTGLLIMLTGFALNLLSFSNLPMWSIPLIWAYTLWIIANWILPYFNSRFPKWKVCSEIWIWAGLGIVLASQPLSMDIGKLLFYRYYWLSVSLYLFLLLRNSGSTVLRWSATGTLTWAGILWIGNTGTGFIWYEESVIVGTLIWANVLLFTGTLWRKLKARGILSEKWVRHDLSSSFQVWSFMISWVCLLILFVINLTVLSDNNPSDHAFLSLTGIVTTTVSFLHLFILAHRALNAHCLIFSVFIIGLTVFNYCSSLPHLPLLLAVWNGVLLSITSYMSQRELSQKTSVTVKAMSGWLTVGPWIVIPALLFVTVASLTESLLTLGILTGIFAVLGHRRKSPGLLRTAHVLGLVLLHTWPLMFVPSEKTQGLVLWYIWPLIKAQLPRFQILMPWYSLQMILIVWIGTAVCRKRPASPSFIRQHFSDNLSFEFGIAVSEWGLHLILFISQLMSDKFYGNIMIQGTAGLVSVSLMIALGIFRLYHLRKTEWVYRLCLLTASAGVYLRLLWIGLSPLTISDAVALMLSGYGLFMIQRFVSDKALSRSLLNVVMLLPILSLITAASCESFSSLSVCAILLTAGTLYLSIRYTSGSLTALFLGILSLNGAIYLWIPAWANHYHLIQLYAAPAALSVLILLHLHRKELKPGTLNSTRLASLTVLYACATLDFFLQPELSNFLIVLFLSLTGAGMGIALRIRAFLYGGVIFMVLNVLAQLFFFYSRQTLGKGIVLVLLGTAIMAAMILFNIRREQFLKRIRIFRADLEQWK